MTTLVPINQNNQDEITDSITDTSGYFSPLLSNSTVTKIDLFHKYKQQILNSDNLPSNSSSFEDLKTYSTPPQSPPLNLLQSSSTPLSPLIKSNLMINEHLKQNDEVKHDLTIRDNIDNLQLKIKENNDLLRENLKKGYERLRKIQATYFQSHVAEQLNKILELKEKLKLDNEIKKEEEKSTQLDDNSVDLLTSILKSNLNNSTNVDSDVKSLQDDIHYEIQKKSDDDRVIKFLNEKANNSETENEDDDSDSTHISDDEDNVFDDVDLALHKLKAVNKKIKTIENNSTETVKTFKSVSLDEHKKLVDSSNLVWNINKSQINNNWETIQTKLKYAKLKIKQCNDYTIKVNRINNVNKQNQLPLNTTTTLLPDVTIPQAQVEKSEEAAIAALSSSLQESVAAVVNTSVNTNETNKQIDESTASRCLPFKSNNFKTKTNSRLFNLNRNDLIKLDDDVIRSLYSTLKYFSNSYFKTMCSCSQLNNKTKRSFKHKSLFKKEQEYNSDHDNYNDDNDPDYEDKTIKKRKNEQIFTLSDLLAINKTCIFCHLLKEYEKKYKTNDSDSKQNETQDEYESNDPKLAVLDSVISDHSYCKQSFNNRRTNTNIKLNKQNELLERLVNERLSRIFDGNKSRNIFDKVITEEDDKFIDAGLDLPPADVQNLPDLSYEELKFLNEIDEDCSNLLSRKIISNENLDDIEICDLEDDFLNSDSYMLSQSLPTFKTKNNKLSSSFSYKPKYRNILKQNKKRKLEIEQNEFVLETCDIPKKGCKKNLTKSSRKQTIKELTLSLPSSVYNARDRRNRSTSSSRSSTTTSSSISYNDSNSGDQTCKSSSSSSTSSGHYYNYCLNSSNKFDIDNIVIPHGMISNSRSVPIEHKSCNVPTPQWRILNIEPIDMNENKEIEQLDDLTYINRHQLKELKEHDFGLKIRNKIEKVKRSKP